MTTGIYKITNLVNDKIYIGASKNIEKRWSNHRCGHTAIADDLKTFGPNSFKFEVLIECPEDMLAQWERDMICLYDSDDPEKGYNSKNDKPYSLKVSESRRGIPLSEKHKRKLSEAHKGHVAWNRGKPAWNKGLKNIYSDETRRKISEAHRGKPTWNKGISCSEETKRKISESHKGHVAWNKGLKNIYSDETRRKLSESHKGHVAWNKGLKMTKTKRD